MLMAGQDLASIPFPPISLLHPAMKKTLCLLKLIESVHVRKVYDRSKNSPLAKNEGAWENSDFIKGTDIQVLD